MSLANEKFCSAYIPEATAIAQKHMKTLWKHFGVKNMYPHQFTVLAFTQQMLCGLKILEDIYLALSIHCFPPSQNSYCGVYTLRT